MPTLSALNDEYLIVIKLSTREAAKHFQQPAVHLLYCHQHQSAVITIKMRLRRTLNLSKKSVNYSDFNHSINANMKPLTSGL